MLQEQLLPCHRDYCSFMRMFCDIHLENNASLILLKPIWIVLSE